MNKKFGIGTGILLGVLLLTSMLTCCKSGGSQAPAEGDAVEVPTVNPAVYDDMKKAEKIFNALPSPLESAMLVKSTGQI
ncbi:MAG: hypothetical protein IPJ37_21945 [Bacteroidales bacterium]|nr:hypothetical protein [Bacteroidales bacterium]